MKKIISFLILLFLCGNTFADELNEVIENSRETNKLNPVLYIQEGINIDKHNISLGKGPEIKNANNCDMLDEFEKKIGQNKVQRLINNNFIEVLGKRLINNNFIEVLGKGGKEEINTVHIHNNIVFTNIPTEAKTFKLYTINPENFARYYDARWLKNYPSIFLFNNSFLPQNLYVSLGSGGNGKETKAEQKTQLIKFRNSSDINYYSYALIPYYEFKIPFDEFRNDIPHNLTIRYDINDYLIFEDYLFSFLNYENGESVGFMEIKTY